MAAYRWVDGLVTCWLTACTPGSVPGPTLGNKDGTTYLSPTFRIKLRPKEILYCSVLLRFTSMMNITKDRNNC